MPDREALQQELGASGRVNILVNGASRLGIPGSDSARAAMVVAASAGADLPGGAALDAGRETRDADMQDSARVAVVSHNLALLLSPDSAAGAIGRTFSLQCAPFSVIGVMAAAEGPAARVLMTVVPFTVRDQALAPTTEVRAPRLVIRAASVEAVDSVREVTRRWVASRGGGAEVRAYKGGRLAQVQQGIVIFKLAMGAFAGIALLVGGIGIMNVLLASVTERTREIGIRKAVGARRSDILMQFLTEALVVTVLGGVIGIATGIGTAQFLNGRDIAGLGNNVQTVISWTSVVAFAVSAAIGIFFGLYPAQRAASLRPIEALRYE
jgi:putative ABC transport system permease protein